MDITIHRRYKKHHIKAKETLKTKVDFLVLLPGEYVPFAFLFVPTLARLLASVSHSDRALLVEILCLAQYHASKVAPSASQPLHGVL